MIGVADFLRLPYSPDLSEGGVAYALRSLPFTYNRVGGSPLERMRRIAAGVAVELAFRRYLSAQGIMFDVKGATPFTDPDRYDLALGGHRCDIKSFLISRRSQIREIRRDPALLLNAPALVPLDQHVAEGHREGDLYLFAFLSGLIAVSRREVKQAIAADLPTYLVYPMPPMWARPNTWVSLGALVLKSEADVSLTVELGGQLESREYASRVIVLPPRQRVEIETNFYALSSLHVHRLPEGRLGVHSPTLQETCVIQPQQWGNIWVYGMEIVFAGYISYREFRQRARLIAAGTRVFQYDQTRTKNLAVEVSSLHPLPELLERLKG
ncbi:MAG: hypothetical protein ACP5QU_10755 [Anaerolineae bacterium]